MVKPILRWAGLFVALSVLAGCERNLPVGPADKEVVLRGADLAPFGFGFKNPEAYETFKRIRYFDGSRELTYELETPESEHVDALYLNVIVSVETSESDARTTLAAQDVGFKIGLKTNGVEAREIENFYPYGDKSTFYLLEKDSRPIGNVFLTRDGKRVFMLTMSGIYFNDAAGFKELIEGRLRKFSSYEPT